MSSVLSSNSVHCAFNVLLCSFLSCATGVLVQWPEPHWAQRSLSVIMTVLSRQLRKCGSIWFIWWHTVAPLGGVDHMYQMLSTKLPGNSPVLPFLCSVPLNQPSSLFLWTNTMSPSLSSSSASLWGGYDTTTLYLGRTARGTVSDWYALQQWQLRSHDTCNVVLQKQGYVTEVSVPFAYDGPHVMLLR